MTEAILLVGGQGTRLRPLTINTPKPMLPVAGRPILEWIVLHLVGVGIRRIRIALNYLGHVIESHFGDGPSPVAVEVVAHSPDPRQHAARDEQRSLVQEALRQIPLEYREVVVLHHIQGLSGKEIASVLGIAEGTVWSRLGRGLQELKQLLSNAPAQSPQPGNRPGERP